MTSLVHIASPLRDYTHGAARVRAEGATLAQLLGDLDRRYPGIRFRMIDEQQRIRPHIRIFIASRESAAREVRDLTQPVAPLDSVHLLCALSGG